MEPPGRGLEAAENQPREADFGPGDIAGQDEGEPGRGRAGKARQGVEKHIERERRDREDGGAKRELGMTAHGENGRGGLCASGRRAGEIQREAHIDCELGVRCEEECAEEGPGRGRRIGAWTRRRRRWRRRGEGEGNRHARGLVARRSRRSLTPRVSSVNIAGIVAWAQRPR